MDTHTRDSLKDQPLQEPSASVTNTSQSSSQQQQLRSRQGHLVAAAPPRTTADNPLDSDTNTPRGISTANRLHSTEGIAPTVLHKENEDDDNEEEEEEHEDKWVSVGSHSEQTEQPNPYQDIHDEAALGDAFTPESPASGDGTIASLRRPSSSSSEAAEASVGADDVSHSPETSATPTSTTTATTTATATATVAESEGATGAGQVAEGSTAEPTVSSLEHSKMPESDSSAEFSCNICFDTSMSPVLTLCGHLFCWSCLHQWLEAQHLNPTCPVCKAGCAQDKVIPIYGRGKEQVDPRSTTPKRPAGQRPEPLRNPNQPGVGGGFTFTTGQVTFSGTMIPPFMFSPFGIQYGATYTANMGPNGVVQTPMQAYVHRMVFMLGTLILVGILLY
ncbi:MAG: hypothetical protein J3Q66DRAFT_192168 [Benniella sp.]|nr:MAG: hypothetical protein J3Q66DRAFT_192168 [Benniella sp.]